MPIFTLNLLASTSLTFLGLFALRGIYRVLHGFPNVGPTAESAPKSYFYDEISVEGSVDEDITDSFDTDGLRAFALSKAGSSMNSDFFEIKQSRNGLITFYIGDVSGRGLMSSLCQSACTSLLKLASGISLDPVSVVSEVNETLAAREMEGRYATLLYGTLELASGRLRLLSAGHPGPIRISRNDEIEKLECAPCLPVGILAGHEYVLTEHRLDPGDTIILYTDGIVEARNSQRQFFGDLNLLRVAREASSLFPRLVVEKIFQSVQDFSPDRRDDQTVVALSFPGLQSEFSTRILETTAIQNASTLTY